MKKFAQFPRFVFFTALLLLVSCNSSNHSNNESETILKGSTTLLVDETLKPIMEDQIEVFESLYEAKIVLEAKSEAEVLQSLVKDSSRIAVLTRTLTTEEAKIFELKKIKPRITKIATDAIAFIVNRNTKDTLIALNDVIHFMQGQSNPHIKGLVFDNPNSSTVRYMNELAVLKNMPEKGVFSFKTNEEVIKYVSENNGMIGVVGMNWLSQPTASYRSYLKNIHVLSVKDSNSNIFVAPSQNNIAEGKYPLTRDLFIINCQGFSGLGMGFASFVAGEKGQRIILKSGLLPVRMPGRNIIIKTKK